MDQQRLNKNEAKDKDLQLLLFMCQSKIGLVVSYFFSFLLNVGVVRPVSRTPLGELKQSNAPADRMYK